jgi:hypothetical protein
MFSERFSAVTIISSRLTCPLVGDVCWGSARAASPNPAVTVIVAQTHKEILVISTLPHPNIEFSFATHVHGRLSLFSTRYIVGFADCANRLECHRSG